MKKLRFVVSLVVAENDYQQEQAAAANSMAHRLGASLEILYAGNDAVAQGQQLLEIIQSPERRPDAILCHPVGTSLTQVAQQAAAAGIGWALLNRDADYIVDLRQTSRSPIFAVTVDQHEVGRIQGRQLGVLLPHGGMALYITGPRSSAAFQMRTAGMESSKPANIQLRTLPANLTEQSGYDAVTRWLALSTALSSPVKLVAAQNDSMTMGARRAFVEKLHGKAREHWANLPYIGCDACPATGKRWVQEGQLTASVFLPPSAGCAFELMFHGLQGSQQPQERTVLSPQPFPPMDKLVAVDNKVV